MSASYLCHLYIFLIIVISNPNSISSSNEYYHDLAQWNTKAWQSPESLMPQKNAFMAVAHWNDSIVLLGGKKFPSYELRFNPRTQTFHEAAQDLPVEISGRGQYYAQLGQMMYFLNQTSGNLVKYDLSTRSVSSSPNWMTGLSFVNKGACLVIPKNNEYLFMIGGSVSGESISAFPMSTTYAYHINDQKWTLGSAMNDDRSEHACVYDPVDDHVYAITGVDKESIEHISVHDALDGNIKWKYATSVGYAMAIPPVALMIESRHEIIIFAGGYTPVFGYVVNLFTLVINCDTGLVSSLPTLPVTYYFYGPSSIIVDNTLYAFGGDGSGGTKSVSSWDYLDLFPTQAPVNAPTFGPTLEPTFDPTLGPVVQTSPDTQTYEQDDDGSARSTDTSEDEMLRIHPDYLMYILIVSSSVLLCGCCVIGLCCLALLRKSMKDIRMMNGEKSDTEEMMDESSLHVDCEYVGMEDIEGTEMAEGALRTGFGSTIAGSTNGGSSGDVSVGRRSVEPSGPGRQILVNSVDEDPGNASDQDEVYGYAAPTSPGRSYKEGQKVII